MTSLLLYGSYGYVGRQVAREAVARDLPLRVAGRDYDRLVEQTEELDQPGRRFALNDPGAVREALEDVDCVLNCAGPFSNTAKSLVDGCIETGTDYIDITGEIPVIEQIADRDEAAADAGVTLLPAAGFSTVPMDCLAAHLVDRLPEASGLSLGVDSFRPPSIGSVRTVIEGIEDGGMIRRDGDLVDVPTAWHTREIDFGRGPRPAVTMPMGDVSTAHYTTGVPNVEVYAVMPQPARLTLKAHRYLAPVLAAAPVRRTLKTIAGYLREGPSKRARQRGSAYIWGEARTEDERIVSRLRTPDPYIVTVDAAVTTAERILEDNVGDGYKTPAKAFGPEFILELNDVDGFVDGPIEGSGSMIDPLLQ